MSTPPTPDGMSDGLEREREIRRHVRDGDNRRVDYADEDAETWPVLPEGYEVVGASDVYVLARLPDGTTAQGVYKTVADALDDFMG